MPLIHSRISSRDACGRVFNAFTGTEFHKTHRRPSEILLILRGISQGTSTARLARELGRHRPHLLRLRHRLQARAMEAADSSPLAGDAAVEADEMDQNAGEKGIRHPDPEDPPRRRANKRRGHGNFARGHARNKRDRDLPVEAERRQRRFDRASDHRRKAVIDGGALGTGGCLWK